MMTEANKKLLFIELCARLPYGVKVKCGREILTLNVNWLQMFQYHLDEIKPYLRPISSMTDEEMDKLFDILKIDKDGEDEDWIKINDAVGIKFFFPTGKWVEHVALAYDYLYSIHIDFRGLITLGLAFPAPDGMYV